MAHEQVYDILDRVRSSGYDPRLEHVEGIYRFDIDGVGTWRVRVDHGYKEVEEGPGYADCVIRCEPDDFVRIATGEQNLVTAFMQGRVHFEGDQILALKLHGILPSPNQQAARPSGR